MDGVAGWDCELDFSLYLGLEKAFPSGKSLFQCTLGCELVYACPAKAACVQGLQGNWWGMSGLFRSTPWACSRAGRSPGPAHWGCIAALHRSCWSTKWECTTADTTCMKAKGSGWTWLLHLQGKSKHKQNKGRGKKDKKLYKMLQRWEKIQLQLHRAQRKWNCVLGNPSMAASSTLERWDWCGKVWGQKAFCRKWQLFWTCRRITILLWELS